MVSKIIIFSFLTGVIAGSPVPPEVMKMIITKMHMPEIVVSCGCTEYRYEWRRD